MAQGQLAKHQSGLFASLSTEWTATHVSPTSANVGAVPEDEVFGIELLGVFYIGRGDQFDDDRRHSR
ncbi:MAG TPA: hypothetical protein VEJ40_06020 [Pseudolabrys sp.]|jgi:hypothetical protein|nr:hypothetical protein [Pseudolabrys sp.]